ncbi:MAG: FAD-dependent monooxygenase [Ekhidna sp.]|nr:FAD-dependent monooxygenase [Ekhidna sp.]
MNRKEFVKMCSLLGVGLPLQASFGSCKTESIKRRPQKVLIIGAGPAGLSAGYLLNQLGIP